jgi:hypothetical protein
MNLDNQRVAIVEMEHRLRISHGPWSHSTSAWVPKQPKESTNTAVWQSVKAS